GGKRRVEPFAVGGAAAGEQDVGLGDGRGNTLVQGGPLRLQVERPAELRTYQAQQYQRLLGERRLGDVEPAGAVSVSPVVVPERRGEIRVEVGQAGCGTRVGVLKRGQDGGACPGHPGEIGQRGNGGHVVAS